VGSDGEKAEAWQGGDDLSPLDEPGQGEAEFTQPRIDEPNTAHRDE
jgi:hypothetical protein